MGKLQISAILILFMLTIIPFIDGDERQGKVEEQEKAPIKPSLAKTTINLPSNSLNPLVITSNWERLIAVLKQAHAHFPPPNINFRGRDEGEPGSGEGGAGGKVKEVVVKSLGKGKATVDDSAKSAAEMAEETVQKTKEKLSNSMSKKEEVEPAELDP